MFEDKDDASRYCGLLEAQDFPLPTVEMIDIEEIKNIFLINGQTATNVTIKEL